MRELAADGVPVAVTCRVLKLSRQPYYRWLADPVTVSEVVEAYRANALFDAHKDDPEFGYRLLADEAREVGESMADRTAWRISSENGWWSAFGKRKARGKGKKAGPPGAACRAGYDAICVPGGAEDRRSHCAKSTGEAGHLMRCRRARTGTARQEDEQLTLHQFA
ncbi:hypothetical protein [Phytoactinopolyspora mesophila]|uniref:hypothetical protein n=1 Tax=Phytoactinopolyspora mesophila TaxID=2650750 RepID=UPI001651DDC8|nr:hypothetical protein [Phytoactinopolyspora mesophila]